MKVKQFFEKHPIFRYDEFAEFMAALGTERPKSWQQQLRYHLKTGQLIHIRKNLYAVKPMRSQEQWIDPYSLASKLSKDAVLAYHAALELYAVAYTTFNEFTFLTTRKLLPFEYESMRFRPVKPSSSLVISSNVEYGIETINRNGIPIKVTSLERTIVDILDRPDLGGGMGRDMAIHR